jgi:MoaA/NifB/PqqE/SkfB family radical SAM enzyme
MGGVASDMINGQNINVDISRDYEGLKRTSGPMMISLDVTDKCNLKCIHCLNNSGGHESCQMSNQELMDVVHQIIEVNPHTVCICGGETTLRSNLLVIIHKLNSAGIIISMVSNGMLIKQELAIELKEAGIQFIQISIDGYNEETHDKFRGVKGSYRNAKNAVKHLKNAGIDVALSFVPNKFNHLEIEDYIEMAVEMKVSSVRMMPLLPIGRAIELEDAMFLNSEEFFKFQRKVYALSQKYINKIYIELGDPLDHFIRMSNNAQIGINTYCVEIRANGDIYFTTYVPAILGNCLENSIKEYWNSGLDKIWGDEKIQKIARSIHNIYDFKELEPMPYSGEYLYYSIL